MNRRRFLQGATWLGTLPLGACSSESPSPYGGAGEPAGPLDPACLSQASASRTLAFEGALGREFGVLSGSGLDGRRYVDLSTLSSERLLTPASQFYVRTAYPDTLDPEADWSIALGGLVESEASLGLAELLAESVDQGHHLVECSGNFREAGFGLMSVGHFRGVPLDRVLARVRPLEGASRVEITGYDEHSQASGGGRSTPGASWVVSPEQWRRTGAFLATHLNGEPLPLDNGFPVRLLNPGWYGCSSVKWVTRLDWVLDDHPASSQMREFAARTHQLGVPELARDYAAPEIQAAAMPVRVERWQDAGGAYYVVVGISWGGSEPVRSLELSFDGGQSYVPVRCGEAGRAAGGELGSASTWRLWSLRWEPERTGRYELCCRILEQPARRLDSQYYRRSVVVDSI